MARADALAAQLLTNCRIESCQSRQVIARAAEQQVANLVELHVTLLGQHGHEQAQPNSHQ